LITSCKASLHQIQRIHLLLTTPKPEATTIFYTAMDSLLSSQPPARIEGKTQVIVAPSSVIQTGFLCKTATEDKEILDPDHRPLKTLYFVRPDHFAKTLPLCLDAILQALGTDTLLL